MKTSLTLAFWLLCILAPALGQHVPDTTRIYPAQRLNTASLPVSLDAGKPFVPGQANTAPDFAGRCNNLPTLTCGGFVSGNTTGGVNAFNANDYKFPFGNDYEGPDKAYRVTVAAQTSAHFVLDILSPNNDLDLILLSQCGDLSSQVVVAGKSLEKNTATGYYREMLDLNLLPNINYTLIVDGKDADHFGNFKVTMNCTCTCIEPGYDMPTGTKLLCDNFQDYQANKALTVQSSRWGLFNNDPLQDNSRDATVKAEASGNQYAQVNYYVDPSGSGNDRTANVLYSMDDRTTGRYRISWKTWVEPNKGGLYYVLHRNADSLGNDAKMKTGYAVFFNPNGIGNLLYFPDPSNANGTAVPFTYQKSAWNNVVNIIDMDNDIAELWINDNFVFRWRFSLTKGDGTKYNQLASILFTGGKTSASIIQDYRIDDLCVWKTISNCPGDGSGAKVCIENKIDKIPEGTARCKLYTSSEWDECQSACEYGGTFAYRGVTYKDQLFPSDIAPNFIKNDPCVVSAYGSAMPDTLYADVYIFKKADNLDLDVILSNSSESCKAFVFACYYKSGGVCIAGQKCLTDVGNTYLPLTCDSIYYVVVTGAKNSKYNVIIVPEGNCPASDIQTVNIDCSQPSLVDFVQFDTFVTPQSRPNLESSAAYAKRYQGNRPYTGGEQIYKITLRNPALVEFTLVAKDPMGMFLFTALCGNECEKAVENVPGNDTVTFRRLLLANDYYLIVDKGTPGGDPNFSLYISCLGTTTVNTIPYSLLFCDGNFSPPLENAKTNILPQEYCGCSGTIATPDSSHYLKIKNGAYNFSPTQQVFFLVRDKKTHDFTSSSVMYENANQIVATANGKEIWLDKPTDTLQCSYAVGDTFFVMIVNKGDGNQNLRFVKPIYSPSQNVNPNVDTFRLNSTSVIDKLISSGSLNSVFFSTDKSGLDPLAADTNFTFTFYSSIPWKAKLFPSVPWITAVSPSSTTTGNVFTQDVTLSFTKNLDPKPRRTLLKFASAQYPEFVYLYLPVEQEANCLFTPKVSILASASTVCKGDTVHIKAVVTDQSGKPISDAFTYKWENGQKTQSFRDTLKTLTPGTYKVTVTGQFCREASTTTTTMVTVRDIPPAPSAIATTNRTACLGASAALTVTNNAPALADIQWFDSPTSNNVLATGNAYTPPAPGQPGAYTFYAQAKYKSGAPLCVSPRIAATLTIRALPTFTITDKKCAPVLETTYSFNVSTTAGNTVAVVAGTGSVSGNNGVFSISGIPKGSNLTFRVTDNSPGACTKDSTVIGLPCNCQAPPKPVPQAVAPVCVGGQAVFTASIPAGSPNFPHLRVDWFTQSAGGLPVKTNALTYTTSLLQTHWAETYDTLSKCRSTERTQMTVAVNALPLIEVLETPCEADFNHYTLVVKRTPGVTLSHVPAVGTTMTGTDRVTITGIPEGTNITLTAINTQTGCTSTLPVQSPECGCPVISPPTGVPGTQTYCAGQAIQKIEVGVGANQTADWLDSKSQVILPNSTIFTPADTSATYFVRARDIINQCTSELRQVKVIIHPLPTVQLSSPVCSPTLLDYSVEFTSADGLASPPTPTGILFTNGQNSFLISNVMKDQDITFVLTNPSTHCMRTVAVTAPECTCASLPPLQPPLFVQDAAYCQGGALPVLKVKVAAGETADWYDANGAQLKAGDTLFVPFVKGVYFAARHNLTNDCVSAGRTPVTVVENPLPTLEVTRKECAVNLASYEVSLLSNADLVTASRGIPSGSKPDYKIVGINRDSSVAVTLTITATGCTVTQIISPKQCNCAAFPVSQPAAATVNPALICANEPMPLLVVNAGPGETAVWYDSLGNVVASDTLRYRPGTGGLFFVEARNKLSGCVSDTRLAYRVMVNPVPSFEILESDCNLMLDKYQLIVKTNGKLNQPIPYVAIKNGDIYTIPDVDLGVALNLVSTFVATGCKLQQPFKKDECPCPSLAAPQNQGDVSVCKDQPLPLLSVSVSDSSQQTTDWYNAAGMLLKAGVLIYQPTVAATTTFFVQTRYKFSGECVSTDRTPVTMTVFEPVQLFAGPNQSICEGEPIQLNGSIGGGISSGFWSAPVGAFSPGASTLNATYQPPSGISSVVLTLQSNAPTGPCPAKSGQITVEIKPRPGFELQSNVCEPNLLTYKVNFKVASNAQVIVNTGNKQFLGSGDYLVSMISRDSNLLVTVSDPVTKCSEVFVVPSSGCPCPVVGIPQMPNNPVICPEENIPFLTVQVLPGQTVNWYSTAGVLLKSDTIAYRPASAGTYFAEAKEIASSCLSAFRTPVTLTVKPSPVAEAGDNVAICPGSPAVLSAVGSFDAYLWSNGALTPTIQVTPPATQYYFLTVTQSGCAATDSVRVTVRDSVVGTIQLLLPIKCFGDANGEIRASATGGTGPYKVLWSVMSGTPKLSNIPAGTYTATISDSPGCTDVVTYQLTQPNPLTIGSSSIQNESNAGKDGSVKIVVAGGTPSYTYQWSDAGLFEIPGATLDFLGGREAGWYFVEVTDANGCILLDSFEIKKTSALSPDPLSSGRLVRIYPNPTDSRLFLHLKLPEDLPVTVNLIDALGRFERLSDVDRISEHTFDYDLSRFPSGLYLLRIQLGQSTVVQKVLIEK